METAISLSKVGAMIHNVHKERVIQSLFQNCHLINISQAMVLRTGECSPWLKHVVLHGYDFKVICVNRFSLQLEIH